MADSDGSVVISFDADTSAIDKKLKEIQKRVEALENTKGSQTNELNAALAKAEELNAEYKKQLEILKAQQKAQEAVNKTAGIKPQQGQEPQKAEEPNIQSASEGAQSLLTAIQGVQQQISVINTSLKETQDAINKNVEAISELINKIGTAGTKTTYTVKGASSRLVMLEKELLNIKRHLTSLEREIDEVNSKEIALNIQKAPLEKQAEQLLTKINELKAEYAQLKETNNVPDKFTPGQKVTNEQLKAYFQMQEINKEIEKTEKEYNSVAESIDKIDQKLIPVQTKMSVLISRAQQYYDQMRKIQEQMQQETVQAHPETETQESTSSAGTEQAQLAASKSEQILIQLREIATQIGSAVQSGINAVSSGLSSTFSKVANAANTVLKPFKAVASAAKTVKSAFSKVANGVKKVISPLKNIVSAAGKAAKSLLGLNNGSGKITDSFKNGIKSILKYGFSVRSLYFLVRKLKSAFTDGFENLAQYSDSTNEAISSMMSAITQLKNSLATAFAPILTVVAPIITNFINMLSSAADAVAQLMAMLTGQSTYTKAIAVQEDYASSLSDTSDSADETTASLASFDEINTIGDEDSSSGSSSSTSASDMFETVEVGTLSFDSWGEAFSSMLTTITEEGIPKLKSALSTTADWINSFSSNLYEMFTFPGVYEQVCSLGTEISQALNDFVSEIDWATLGAALGAGINTAIGFLVSLVSSFDFLSLGESLATFLNNGISQIDWYNLGTLLMTGFKAIFLTLAGLLLNLDMTEVATSLSELVIGALDTISQTIQEIDWQGLGNQVMEFLINIDWGGIAASVYEIIGSAFGAAAGFLWGLIQTAWEAVKEWWSECMEASGGNIFVALLTGILDIVASIGIWIYENVFRPFINGFKSAFGISSDDSEEMETMGGSLMDGLLEGIASKINAVIETFSGLWEDIKGVFGEIGDWFSGKFSDAWQAVKDVFSTGGEIFDGIKDGILDGLKGVVNKIIQGINKVIAVPFNGLNSALTKIKNISILGLTPFSFISTISVPQIPELAAGAVIPPNKEFLAVLGDQTSGTNIETPESLLRQIVREETASDNSELLQAILEAIQAGQVIKVNETVLGRTTAKAINNITKASGTSVLLV